jgi:hypothetical protein
MKEGINPKYWHWLETPKPRIKKVENKTGFKNFIRKIVLEILGSWEI